MFTNWYICQTHTDVVDMEKNPMIHLLKFDLSKP